MNAQNRIEIDLNAIHAAFGYVPHPQQFRDNPGNLIGLSKVVNREADTSIGALDIVGVAIGYEDDDFEIADTADDANIGDESSFWVWVKDDAVDDDDGVICDSCGELTPEREIEEVATPFVESEALCPNCIGD